MGRGRLEGGGGGPRLRGPIFAPAPPVPSGLSSFSMCGCLRGELWRRDLVVTMWICPQILKDTFAESCVRISQEERSKMKELLGTVRRPGSQGLKCWD